MDEETPYPGLVGAGISAQQRSPYDRSFKPGEATTEDVRDSLWEMFLSGLGLVPGGVLSSSGSRVAGSRTRRIGPSVQERNRVLRDQERDARPSGYPIGPRRIGPSVQERNAILAGSRGSGADTGGLDLFNEGRLAAAVERKFPGARILSARSPISGVSRDVELRLPDGRIVKTMIGAID